MSQKGAWRSCRAGSTLGKAPGATCLKAVPQPLATIEGTGGTREVAERPPQRQQLQAFLWLEVCTPWGCAGPRSHKSAQVRPKQLQGARSWHKVWQVSAPVQSPKQGDSGWGRHNWERRRRRQSQSCPQGQGRGCHKGAWWLLGAGKNNLGISSAALG